MRITNLSAELKHTKARGGVTVRVSALTPHAMSSTAEPAEPLPQARLRSQPKRRPETPPPEGRPEPAPEADTAAMRAPTRAALIAAKVSIRHSMSFHLRERGRTICDRILADSSCQYRRDSDTIRIWGELDAVFTAIRRCERAMHHGSLHGFEFRPLSQADAEEHAMRFSQPTQPAADTNREGRGARPELPPENPEQRGRTDGFAEPDNSAASA